MKASTMLLCVGMATTSNRLKELINSEATAGAGTRGDRCGVSDCGPGVPLVGSPHTSSQHSIVTGEAAADFACAQQAISAMP